MDGYNKRATHWTSAHSGDPTWILKYEALHRAGLSNIRAQQLRLAVIGAGVAGITTAWELLQDGHEVTVFDALGGAAEATSFASPGVLAPAMLSVWDTGMPGWPDGLRKHWLPPKGWPNGPTGLGWATEFRKHASGSDAAVRSQKAYALGQYGSSRVADLSARLGFDYELSDGVLVLFRSPVETLAHAPKVAQLKEWEVPLKELTPESARQLEPALSCDTPFDAAIHLPQDSVFNGRQWLSLVKHQAMRKGCGFQFQTKVRQVDSDGTLWTAPTEPGSATTAEASRQQFDAVVICNANQGAELATRHQPGLPLLALDYCAITAPIRERLDAPESAVLDLDRQMVISRTGQRIRVSCGRGLAPQAQADSTYKDMYQALGDWFPGAARYSGPQGSVQQLRGRCVHTPDGLPLVGQLPGSKIWLNTAHGSRGWTFAPGTARVLADQITGNTPEFDGAVLSPMRWFQG